MQRMISEALGGVPVYPVHPVYVLSTDDTALFVFEGIDVHDGARLGSRNQRGNVHGSFTTSHEAIFAATCTLYNHDLRWRVHGPAVHDSNRVVGW